MCGRFTQTYTWAEIFAMYYLVPATPRNLQPRYNIAPTTMIGTVRLQGDDLTYADMRWGLVPGWWKKPLKDLPSGFNARSEDIVDKPMFRAAFKSRRCLIPASGFFEWTGPKQARQPWFISARNGEILSFAGLYEQWRNPQDGETIASCTILTTTPNRLMQSLHDRMPVILTREDWRNWLTAGPTDVLKPANDDLLQAWRVSPRVNSSRYQGEDSMQPEPAGQDAD